MIGTFLKTNAKSTTVALVILMIILAIGGIASGERVSAVIKTLGYVLLFWPVIFVLMIPFTLLAKARVKAAEFGASLGRQAVNSPRKDAGQAVREATAEAFGAPTGAAGAPRTAGAARPPAAKREVRPS